MNIPYVMSVGSSVNLSGTTQFGTPGLDLGGTVLEDELTRFSAASSSGPVTGTLQDRVVRMGDGTLAFYTRISAFSGVRGITEILFDPVASWWPATLNVDFRTDGLGVVGPQRVNYESSGFVRWIFDTPITPGALSRFMFLIVPRVTRYGRRNRVTVRGGPYWANSRALDCFAPEFA